MKDLEPGERRIGGDGEVSRKTAEAAVRSADLQARGYVCLTGGEAEQGLSPEEFQERRKQQIAAYRLSRVIDEDDTEGRRPQG